MTSDDAYRQGMIDAIQEKQTLVFVLWVAEERILSYWYGEGWIAGHRLQCPMDDLAGVV